MGESVHISSAVFDQSQMPTLMMASMSTLRCQRSTLVDIASNVLALSGPVHVLCLAWFSNQDMAETILQTDSRRRLKWLLTSSCCSGLVLKLLFVSARACDFVSFSCRIGINALIHRIENH